ncbi:MAG: hypothetical protein QM493_03685 [Sulfurovum sp.]
MKKLSFYLSLLISILMFLSLNSCNSPSLFGKKVKKEYFQGGKIRSEFIMDDKTGQNGILKQYGYESELKSLTHIRNGVKNGEEIGYDKKGRVISRYNYINGKLHGTQISYYPNGDKMITHPYVNGILHGKAKTYRIDGKVSKEVTYKNGKLIN